MKKSRLVVSAAVVLVVIALVAWWFVRRDAADAGQLTLHGNVDIRQVSLAFDGSGRVASLAVEEGDQVKAGQRLATLDTRSLALQAEQALAQIEVQQQTLAKLRNGSRPQEVSQAQSRATAAQAQAQRAEQDLARLQDISANTQGRGVSSQELAHARSQVQVARAQAAEQQDALRLAQLGPRAEEIDVAQAQLKSAQAQLALLQLERSHGELIAPSDAVVRSRLVEPGDMATPQRAIYTLALTHPKWVRVYVEEADLGRIKPGMPARISTDSQPGQSIQGKVGYIASVAEFTPKSVETEALRTSLVYEVRVITQDKDDQLRLGQPATVRLSTTAAP
ncbi:HlyD family efflux transporter periplasmic adaptor subunit [Pseudoxanthomonas sp.]|uniref:efflux RND transporter periplasmic adaptor subunit n=1 Tax=Pseudoxanthomonas sp. TaxID=1871049 RepID=UPI0026195548|nr:HlyD family efflux transporter periplasmic adaptor subunit [Pseudoxanthomonas sp.]WDS34795.1 MAG: efflux RND transporter periplasmic adaptor subunit [Pseudoxanthomonas sp.]